MRLKEIRNIKGLSQKELSEKLNLKQNTISSYESSSIQPSLENLIKIADILDVSVDTLLGRDANIVDLNLLSENQKYVVEKVVKFLSDNDVAKVVGYIDNLNNK